MMLTVLAVTAPVFLVAAMGFAGTKFGMRFDAETISGLSNNIGMPCLVFSALAGIDVEAEQLARVALSAGLALGGCVALSAIVLRLAGLPFSHYLPSLGFPNLGNMGLPMSYFAFGDEGLALAMGYLMIGSISHLTIGMWLASGKILPGDLFRNPILYVIPLALLFRFGGLDLPQWLANSTKLAGDMAMPVMLLALGASLSQIGMKGATRGFTMALLRFAIGISTGWAVAELMGLSGALRGVVILQTSMPAAVYNYILALRYNTDAETVAGIVMQSSLMSMLILPLLLLWLLP